MPLINCDINPILTWSANSVIVSTNVANEDATFAINAPKLYFLVVTLSTQENSKLLQQAKSVLKRAINTYTLIYLKNRISYTKRKFKPFSWTKFLRIY